MTTAWPKPINVHADTVRFAGSLLYERAMIEIKSGMDGPASFRLQVGVDTREWLLSQNQPVALELWVQHWREDGQDEEWPWLYFKFPAVRWVGGFSEFGSVLYGKTEWDETCFLTPDGGEPEQAGYGGWYYTVEGPPQA